MALQDILPLTSNDFSRRWNTEVPTGTPNFVTYSFGDAKAGYDSEDRPGFNVWTEAHKAHVRAALSVWDAASGIKFLEVPDVQNGQIRFSMYDMTGEVTSGGAQVAGFAYYPHVQTWQFNGVSQSEVIVGSIGGDVFLNGNLYAADPNSLAPGNWGYRVILHEIGHALGFKHPFEGSPVIAPQFDNDDYTVMTYNGVGSTVSLGSLDIEASQYYYGATDAGYTWDAQNLKLTIYGTDSADVRLGTELADTIVGLGGDDLIIGKYGNDTLDGGSGADRMIGGAGDDTYVVDSISDEVFEMWPNSWFDAGGVDTVQSLVALSLDAYAGIRFVENLVLTGTANINGTGNGLNNAMSGNSGNNTLDGGSGADTMLGGAGNDSYFVDSWFDQVFETTTTASLVDAGGVDSIQSSVTFSLDAYAGVRFVENLTLTGHAPNDATGNALANRLTGNAFNNVLDGGLGNDMMIGGAGYDTYVVDSIGDQVFETTTTASLIDAGGIDIIRSSVAFSLDAYAGVRFVEILELTGTANINGFGNALNNSLIGNAGSNTLNGGLGDDNMFGGAGNDFYVVDSIGDRVDERTFFSLIDAGGIDTVQSSVSFSLAASTVEGVVERLTLTGTANIDGTGNALANVMLGNSGNNTLDGGLGADIIGGGAGNDIYVVDSASDFVFETATISTLVDAGGVDTILSSVSFSLDTGVGVRFVENLTLTGSANINGAGNALANLLTGNSGNNTLNGGLGADIMGGGAGNDIYVVDSIADEVFETTTISSLIDAGGVDTIQSSVSTSLDASAGVRFVERLTLTGVANINGTGNALDNVMIGNAASNTLNGGLGNDLMMGGAGNDFYVVDSIGDRVYETTAVSSLIDAGGVDTIQSSVALSLDAYAAVRFIERLTLTGAANINGLGNTLDNVMIGNSGNNVLNGGLGADLMVGGAGNDIYVVDSISDRVYETTTVSSGVDAGGVDTIQSSVALSLDANAGVRFVERLTLAGMDNINGLGNALDNVLIGNSGNNVLNGGLGADIMGGGAGNDIYVIDNIGDFVFETTTISTLIDAGGIDTIQSSLAMNLDAAVGVRFVENLTLTGTANINGTGNALANVLTGNSGNNTLNGGLGNDILIGGLGADTFVFSTTLGASNIDQITGFSVVDDTIRLDDVVFVGLATTTLAANAFVANLTGEAATDFDRIIYETDTGALFYDSDGVGILAARIQFATLAPGLVLTNTDFFVI